ncbi:VOC family protein [Actinoplanes sp. NPDC051470]|uniref:VOC family protein n=1 Tax=unclassified Actinoplanes TaxID=2626549 RepID=UPI003419C23E
MANEVTVPLLPCRDVDEITAFYAVLGFRATYRQPGYVALRRADLNLHFFVVPEFEPETSYGSCLVLVDDIGALHRAFADGMRSAYGKVLVSGVPRMTRPRVRAAALGGFSIVDPAGNWIRVIAHGAERAPGPRTVLARALEHAVVLADVQEDHGRAAAVLDGALGQVPPEEDPALMVEALAYRAELALVLGDERTAAEALDRARELDATGAELAEFASELDRRVREVAGTVLGYEVRV